MSENVLTSYLHTLKDLGFLNRRSTLALHVHDICVGSPADFVTEVHTQVFVMPQNLDVQFLKVQQCGQSQVNHQPCYCGGCYVHTTLYSMSSPCDTPVSNNGCVVLVVTADRVVPEAPKGSKEEVGQHCALWCPFAADYHIRHTVTKPLRNVVCLS